MTWLTTFSGQHIDEVCHIAADIYQARDEDAAQVIIDDIRVKLSAVPKLGTDNA